MGRLGNIISSACYLNDLLTPLLIILSLPAPLCSWYSSMFLCFGMDTAMYVQLLFFSTYVSRVKTRPR